ncbi:GGDEF-domain containing protein [Oceanisphaera marina]|uniref:GGDEF-domain containing protein n=1 Tax=Oceanisphaera marina TaxID=2017550 RepID=A0ABQ1IT66_9GAMM|nr:EAL domain-containing protein [Oceanisphaera marina]GGB51920.1 GGDEF-domain containing protein [Oceanisphaera marina]
MKRIFASYPHIDGQYGRVHPFKLALGGMLLLGIVWLGSHATHTLMNIRQHNALLEQRTYEVPWSLMQLQLEMGRFLDAVRLRHADAITQEEFMLRYDILWSRTPILLSNQFKNTLSERPDLWLLIRQIDTRVHELEPSVQALQPGAADYLLILTELSPYLEPLSRTVTATMHDNVRFYAEYDQAYRKLGKQLYHQIIGLFIVLGLLLLLLFRELRRYWQLQQQDPLTGLPNRFALQRHLTPMIEQAVPFSVTVLELKDFTEYHHRFGFKVIDSLLQECCLRLQHSLQPHEFIAQPDQNGVMIVARGVVELEEVRAQMSRFRQALAEKAVIDAHNFYMEPIMGVVLYPADADNLVDLLARGELALELCKKNKSPYVFFDPSLLKEMSRRQQLAKDLPAALDSGSLSLQLQPVVEWPGRQCIGLQVLMSWHHPSFGVISTTELLRVTEQYQRSESLTLWALRSVCAQLTTWQRYSSASLFISLKIPTALFRAGVEQSLLQVLESYAVSPESLVLEISENVAMKDPRESMIIMEGIRAAGIRIIMSEFGSGCSALGYLSQLPLNWLQLDPTFCSGIEHEGGPRRQLETLVAMGQLLQLPIIHCGVDHPAELAVLETLASPLLVQGDTVGEILLATEVRAWLEQYGQQ